jgi:cytochrome oxidase Cu insertion factor (SCO1/SenC/PrrC family)
MNHADPSATPNRKRNRMMLLAIFALFFGSLFFAGVLRFSGWRPAGMKNKGELLQPPADLRAVTPKLLDGTPYAWAPINRVWRITVAPPVDCGAECTKTVEDLYKVWELLGREATRVDVLWLCPSVASCDLPPNAPKLATLRLLQADAGLREKLPRVDLVTFVGHRGVPVYVVDPNGFVILRYAAGSDPGDLRSDLAKLLKLK